MLVKMVQFGYPRAETKWQRKLLRDCEKKGLIKEMQYYISLDTVYSLLQN